MILPPDSVFGRATEPPNVEPIVLQLLEQMGFEPNLDGYYFNTQKRIWIRVFSGDTPADIAERIFRAGSQDRKQQIKELLGG